MATKMRAAFPFAMSTSILLLFSLLVAVDSSERGRLFFAPRGRSFHRDGDRVVGQQPPSGEDETVLVRPGEDAVLECEAGGTPTPAIHWLSPQGERIHQGVRTSHSADREELEKGGGANHGRGGASLMIGATKSRLFISCAGPQDAGAYTCVADTPTRRIAATHRLVVDTSEESAKRLFPSRMSKERSAKEKREHTGSNGCATGRHESGGARIYMWTALRVELDGTDVQLICRAEGRPAPRVTWMDRDNQRITAANEQYELLDSGDLLIRRISWHNMGNYRCLAENEFGTDDVTTFLYPTAEEKPDHIRSIPDDLKHSEFIPPHPPADHAH